MNKKINLIIAPQEYVSANHNELWKEINNSSDNLTIILNISSDFVVTLAKRKFNRLKETLKGPIFRNKNLVILRPLFIIRPEISSKYINKVNSRMLKKQLEKLVKNLECSEINVLYYSGVWTPIINNMNLNTNLYYYIMDEVGYYAHNNTINKKQLSEDNIACENSKMLFLMSNKLIEKRSNYINKIKVIGNGSTLKDFEKEIIVFNKSVGIIGNIRNWINQDLLEKLINLRTDLHFGFVGNIEKDMISFMKHLSSKYKNVTYYGIVNKEEVHNWYKKFNVIIVPYIENDFMKATRPIKIVESIFAGTPVVTIKISGYEESSFIKYASTVHEFSEKIDYYIDNKINVESKEYIDFIHENSWEAKAIEILKYF